MSSIDSPSARQVGNGALIVAFVSSLIVNANTSGVGILLPTISADTGTSLETMQWAVTAYSLVGAACIVTAGALGDVFGRRKVFLGGLVLFIASCAFIALSQTGGGVIAGRAIQGAAGSTLLASGMSLISVAYDGPRRIKALTLWGASAGVGAAVGPLLGGVLVAISGWQALFILDAAVAVVLIPITLRAVEESSDPTRSRSIDWAGTFLIAGCLAPLVFVVSNVARWGLIDARTIILLAVSIAAGVAFVQVERRIASPILDLSLLRNRMLVSTTIVILLAAGTLNAMSYLLSLYFQSPDTLGFSALETGLATLPLTLALILCTPVVTRMSVRFGGRTTIVVGFVAFILGYGVLVFTQADWRYLAFLVPLLLVAIGMALANGPASSAATSSVSSDDVGAASGISNVARYIGPAVFTAAVAAIYASVQANQLADGATNGEALAAAFGRANLLLALICVAGLFVAFVVKRRQRPAAATALETARQAGGIGHTIPVLDDERAAAGR